VKLAGDVLPAELVDGTPYVPATIELPGTGSAPLRLLIDTGATSVLALNTPTVDRLRLAEPPSAILPIVSGPLLAGRPQSAMRRLPAIRLGSQRLTHAVVVLARETEGDRADSTHDGYLGGELLQRFTVWVDFPHQRIVLVPGPSMGEPFEFDMTGVSLMASGPDFTEKRVRSVLNGSPAAAAGFEAGDVLKSIDGEPTATMTLDGIRALFRVPDRTRTIEVVRAGEAKALTLKTRRLI